MLINFRISFILPDILVQSSKIILVLKNMEEMLMLSNFTFFYYFEEKGQNQSCLVYIIYIQQTYNTPKRPDKMKA